MGYGMKPPGPWGPDVKNFIWCYQNEGRHANFEAALDIWQQELGITFTRMTKIAESPNPHFTVDVIDTKFKSGKTIWERSKKVMRILPGDSLGTCLHEIGHLLGISHEQDRQDQRQAFYTDYGKNATEREMLLYGCALREKDLQDYGAYDADSIMQYPETHYTKAQTPSAGDFATAKQINEW